MALIFNNGTAEIKGRTISFRYRHKKIGQAYMKVIDNELEVVVPEGTTGAELNEFLQTNSNWILSHLKERPASPAPGERTEKEFKALVANICRKYAAQARSIFGKPAEMPQIKYRQMSRSLAAVKPDKQLITLNCQLKLQPKELIEFVLAFAIAEIVDPEKAETYAKCVYTLEPELGEVRSRHIEILKNYKIPVLGSEQDPG